MRSRHSRYLTEGVRFIFVYRFLSTNFHYIKVFDFCFSEFHVFLNSRIALLFLYDLHVV